MIRDWLMDEIDSDKDTKDQLVAAALASFLMFSRMILTVVRIRFIQYTGYLPSMNLTILNAMQKL